jgi:hypothetical protein
MCRLLQYNKYITFDEFSPKQSSWKGMLLISFITVFLQQASDLLILQSKINEDHNLHGIIISKLERAVQFILVIEKESSLGKCG